MRGNRPRKEATKAKHATHNIGLLPTLLQSGVRRAAFVRSDWPINSRATTAIFPVRAIFFVRPN